MTILLNWAITNYVYCLQTTQEENDVRRCAHGIRQSSKLVSSNQLHNVGSGRARSGGAAGGSINLHRVSMLWGSSLVHGCCMSILGFLQYPIGLAIFGNCQQRYGVCSGSSRRGERALVEYYL